MLRSVIPTYFIEFGPFRIREKLFCSDKFAVTTNILRVRMVYHDLTNFGQKADKPSNAPPIKFFLGNTEQKRLSVQNHAKLIDHVSWKLQPACN